MHAVPRQKILDTVKTHSQLKLHKKCYCMSQLIGNSAFLEHKKDLRRSPQ